MDEFPIKGSYNSLKSSNKTNELLQKKPTGNLTQAHWLSGKPSSRTAAHQSATTSRWLAHLLQKKPTGNLTQARWLSRKPESQRASICIYIGRDDLRIFFSLNGQSGLIWKLTHSLGRHVLVLCIFIKASLLISIFLFSHPFLCSFCLQIQALTQFLATSLSSFTLQ